jgi:methionyl-tRNA formyltransferase
MRIVFMGTPDFAVPALEKLISEGYEVVGVFTQPDKPKNRGMKLTPSPVKVCAQAHGLPVFQPTSFKKEPEALETLQSLRPDLVVVAAFGQILPQAVLDVPPLGSINIHSSLLPKYRGAAPINWAILDGQEETGVTIMKMALALDAGDIISQTVTPIDPNETVETLHDRLARLGADLLVKTVEDIRDGTAVRTPQEEDKVTLAPMLSRALSPMDFTRPARALHDQVRGLIPWPAAVTELNGVRCKIFATTVLDETTGKAPGTVLQADKKGLKLACGEGTVLQIDQLQADGGKRMLAPDYLRGHPIPVG